MFMKTWFSNNAPVNQDLWAELTMPQMEKTRSVGADVWCCRDSKPTSNLCWHSKQNQWASVVRILWCRK